MAQPHIISWGASERSLSPVSTTTPSVVSIESITSDTSSTLPEPSVAPQSRVKSKTFHVTLGNKASGVRLADDDPFTRHDKYYFMDGNITFLVDGILYCVHRYFFYRDSTYFSTRLEQLGIREHEALSIIISLGDVEGKDFEAFLSVIYPDDFEEHDLSYEQWKSVLHLSTRWGFASLRKLALRSLKPPTPFDQLLLARAYSVDHWVLPALSALCERTVPLSLNEARQMSTEDIVLVTTVREDIRHHALQVDSDEIPYCIEAARAGMHAVAAGHSASPRAGARGETPTSPSTSFNSNRTTERSARSTAAVAENVGAEGEEEIDDDAKTAVATSPVDARRVGKAGSDAAGEKSPGPNAVLPSAEKPFMRPTSAWGKILVVPSPTLSLAPHSPVGDTAGTEPLESYDALERRRRLRIASARRPSPPPVLPKAATYGLSDSDWD